MYVNLDQHTSELFFLKNLLLKRITTHNFKIKFNFIFLFLHNFFYLIFIYLNLHTGKLIYDFMFALWGFFRYDILFEVI